MDSDISRILKLRDEFDAGTGSKEINNASNMFVERAVMFSVLHPEYLVADSWVPYRVIKSEQCLP